MTDKKSLIPTSNQWLEWITIVTQISVEKKIIWSEDIIFEIIKLWHEGKSPDEAIVFAVLFEACHKKQIGKKKH